MDLETSNMNRNWTGNNRQSKISPLKSKTSMALSNSPRCIEKYLTS
jgi:hypothetical protein